MVYVTGDIHGNPVRLSANSFPEQKEMTKDDVVIICGDFGLVWNYLGEDKEEKYWLDWLEEKPFTTVFIDGNHDNHVRLNNDYPVKEWNGGKVHEIRPSVLHLMRGEVFTIENKKFFTFGGASSHDIQDGILEPDKDAEKIKKWNKDYSRRFRVRNRTWWEEELPSEEEKNNGILNLETNGWKVDYVITHSPSASMITLLGRGLYKQDALTKYLEDVRAKLDYKKWMFGHMHINWAVNEKEIGIYEQIIRMV